MACLLENDNHFSIAIPSYETKTKPNNVTFYVIHVTVGDITWSVSHRYNDFAELHEVLIAEHCIAKEMLPQKKLIGNRDPEFIEKRKVDLEAYLRVVINYLQRAMPMVLVKFLDFDKYDITYMLQNMAFKCYMDGDTCLMKSSEYTFNTLQLHAISERLQKCCFPAEGTNNQYDFSHIIDFCQKLHTVIVRGGRSNIGTSNICYNSLQFVMIMFKSVAELHFYNVHLPNICDFGSVRSTVCSFTINNSSLKQLTDALLGDRVHKTLENSDDAWSKLAKIDFSWNDLDRIDEGIVLVPNLQSLTLDGNQIRKIENIESVPKLTNLCMSANNIEVEDCLYSQLKNVVHLNLSQNRITKLSPFAKLVNLKSLDLASNSVSAASEIRYVCNLPKLDYLVLTGNPLSTIIDYRVKVFEAFGNRAQCLCLDNERPSQKELDTAAVLRALTVVREGKTPITIPTG